MIHDMTSQPLKAKMPAESLAPSPQTEIVLPPQPQPRSFKRGMGRLFQRGAKWWIAYYIKKDGRSVEVRESAGTTETDARRALKRRQDELSAHRIGARRFQGPQQERITVRQLLDDLER